MFDNARILFNSERSSNDQGFWLDDEQHCDREYQFVTEVTIRNRQVSTTCDGTNQNWICQAFSFKYAIYHNKMQIIFLLYCVYNYFWRWMAILYKGRRNNYTIAAATFSISNGSYIWLYYSIPILSDIIVPILGLPNWINLIIAKDSVLKWSYCWINMELTFFHGALL